MLKKLSLLLSALVIGFVSYSQDNLESKENVIDDVNFSLPGTRAIPVVGQLNGSSPTFIKPSGVPLSTVAYDPACNGSFASPGVNLGYYSAYTFTATATEELVLTVETPNSAICCHEYDPMVYLYCGSFDPVNPLVNLRAGNDDAGTGFWAAFPSGSGVMVEAGNSYTLVITHWSTIPNLNGNPMDFTLTVENDVVLQGNSIPVSDWALVFGIVLIVTATIFRMRKLA